MYDNVQVVYPNNRINGLHVFLCCSSRFGPSGPPEFFSNVLYGSGATLLDIVGIAIRVLGIAVAESFVALVLIFG